MSILKVDELQSRTSGNRITLPDVNNYPPYRNLIINGDMSIAQRGTSQASISSGGYYTCDRWRTKSDGSFGAFTQSQDTDVPTGQGFAKSLKMDCTTTHTITANDALQLEHRIEGQNLQMLKKGTSNAESVTLSFWVKSNKTGTYIAELFDADNTRTINKSYTIDASNTWEKKTITYAGDTTGAFNNDNNLSLYLIFWLGAGSTYTSGTLATSWQARVNADRAVGQVNLADSTANDWYITGVQLEIGDSATPFEHIPYDVNLQRCERYCQTVSKRDSNENHICLGIQYNSTTLYMSYEYRTVMRVVPSLTAFSGTSAYRFYRDNTYDQFNSFTIDSPNEYNCSFYNNGQISGTQGQAGFIRWDNTGSSSGNSIILDAEL